jgi:four helix bundle protein
LAYKDFTSLSVWQKASRLLLIVYRVTESFPDTEKYGLVSNMRRAANSVPDNVAEGFGRYENKDKSRFYKISRGSSYEIISQTFSSYSLGYISAEDKNKLMEYKDVINELDKIIKTVESRPR